VKGESERGRKNGNAKREQPPRGTTRKFSHLWVIMAFGVNDET